MQLEINFLISQSNHMLWVLKTYVKTDGTENIHNLFFMLIFFVYLDLCVYICNL